MQTEIRRRSTNYLEEIVAILIERHRVLASQIQGLQKTWTEDNLHDVRVACRRLRSTIRTFSPLLDSVAFSAYDHRLKRFMKKFNEIRDLDVQCGQFETLRKPVSRVLSEGILHIRTRIFERRQRLERKLREFLQTENILKTLALPQIQSPENAAKLKFHTELLIPDLIEACKKYAEISWEETAHNSAPLHALRIQIKRVRYGIENFLPKLGKEGRFLIQRLRPIQDCLGWIHDGDVLCEFLKKHVVQELKKSYRASKKFFDESYCLNPISRKSESLKNFQHADLFKAVRFLLRQIWKNRTKNMKLAKKKFGYFERRDWARSLKKWFETGKCPKQWKGRCPE